MNKITKNCIADVLTGAIYCGIWGDVTSLENMRKRDSIREETQNPNYMIMSIKASRYLKALND